MIIQFACLEEKYNISGMANLYVEKGVYDWQRIKPKNQRENGKKFLLLNNIMS